MGERLRKGSKSLYNKISQMFSKLRLAIALGAIALLTAESNAVKLTHDLDEAAAAGAGAEADAGADGDSGVSVDVNGAGEGDVDVGVDADDDHHDDDCCGCGGNEVDIDINFAVNVGGEAAAPEESGEAAAEEPAEEMMAEEMEMEEEMMAEDMAAAEGEDPVVMDSMAAAMEGDAEVTVVDEIVGAAEEEVSA